MTSAFISAALGSVGLGFLYLALMSVDAWGWIRCILRHGLHALDAQGEKHHVDHDGEDDDGPSPRVVVGRHVASCGAIQEWTARRPRKLVLADGAEEAEVEDGARGCRRRRCETFLRTSTALGPTKRLVVRLRPVVVADGGAEDGDFEDAFGLGGGRRSDVRAREIPGAAVAIPGLRDDGWLDVYLSCWKVTMVASVGSLSGRKMAAKY